ncbi:ADP/ATP-dependent (S)-NAD(P)H-hydrate dehydratase [uncultured Rothia sp.]|uniref:ADP-dependent NAD(P)H-hydrate dehydratase n=1 Tax=uncultured Rothia sp. TaxID=316088 RepID=UPI0032164613
MKITLQGKAGTEVELGESELASIVPRPQAKDHKYTRGVLGVICGSEDYPGAALMSTRAAVNTGPGMVRFIGNAQLNFQVQNYSPEVVCSNDAPEDVRVQAWAAGSGATSRSRQEEITHTIHATEAAVLDAAAVDIAGRWVGTEGQLEPHKILTPHAGELKDFLQWIHVLNETRWQEVVASVGNPDREHIEKEPRRWARIAAELSGATILLKGATTVIASPTGETVSINGGTSWLATAGSGDTLTGILGALLAQHEAHRQQSGDAKPEASTYARLAACAVRIHHRAAALVHSDGLEGPVPPSAVATHISAATASFLACR